VSSPQRVLSNSVSESGLTEAARDRIAKLIAKAETAGAVRVIVGLRVAFRPEGALTSPQAVQDQRNAISQAQDSLLANLIPYGPKGIKPLRSLPYLGMEAGPATLAYLRTSDAVSSVEEDVPVPPLLAESVPLIGAPNVWATGFTGAGQSIGILD